MSRAFFETRYYARADGLDQNIASGGCFDGPCDDGASGGFGQQLVEQRVLRDPPPTMWMRSMRLRRERF